MFIFWMFAWKFGQKMFEIFLIKILVKTLFDQKIFGLFFSEIENFV